MWHSTTCSRRRCHKLLCSRTRIPTWIVSDSAPVTTCMNSRSTAVAWPRPCASLAPACAAGSCMRPRRWGGLLLLLLALSRGGTLSRPRAPPVLQLGGHEQGVDVRLLLARLRLPRGHAQHAAGVARARPPPPPFSPPARPILPSFLVLARARLGFVGRAC